MSDIADVITLVRYAVEDFTRTQSPGDIYSYGSSSVFTLTEPNVVAITGVFINDVSTSSYTYNSTSRKVTISATLTSGDTIEVQYTYNANYSDAEIESYVRAANIHLSLNNYQTWELDTLDNFYPDITDAERNLIAMVTSILMKPDNVSYRLPDIIINVPNSLPTRDLVSKAIKIFKHNTTGVFEVIGEDTQ